MRSRSSLIAALEQYTTIYNEEREFISRFLSLLQHPRSFHRDHLPGHITGSSFIIDPTGKLTLLTHHATLNKWLQPGGHADGEEDVLNVAQREAEEETGLKKIELILDGIFDLDIHPIPERKGFPLHDHYDVRFLFRASPSEQIHISEESHDVAWKPIEELAQLTDNNRSMTRLAEKVELLFRGNQ